MRVTFRPLARADLQMIYKWRQRPHVAEWWPPPASFEEVHEEFVPIIEGREPVAAYIAMLEGRPLGYIQSYVPAHCHEDGWWLEVTDPGMRGIDQFLADGDRLGQGLGTGMVRAFVEDLFCDGAVTRVQTDPDPANGRAIRCYEKAGFRRDRVTDTPDGPALVMIAERPARARGGEEA